MRQFRRLLGAWRDGGGARARFITAFYPATGVRPSELRLAHLEDLNTKTWEFTVRHPKGEGTYGDRRVVIILPQARETVKEYLTERKKYVQSNGLKEATALVPNCSERKDEFYSSNAFRKLKKRVQDLAGVEFKLKDFRPTFATQTAELNPNLIPDISSQLGHSSIVTTQRYYVDIRRDSARRRIEEAWIHKNEQEASMYPKKDLIEKGKYLSGYA